MVTSHSQTPVQEAKLSADKTIFFCFVSKETSIRCFASISWPCWFQMVLNRKWETWLDSHYQMHPFWIQLQMRFQEECKDLCFVRIGFSPYIQMEIIYPSCLTGLTCIVKRVSWTIWLLLLLLSEAKCFSLVSCLKLALATIAALTDHRLQKRR